MGEIIRAFTGPSKLTKQEVTKVKKWIDSLSWPKEVRSGCALGLDTVAATHHDESVLLHLFVPGAPYNVELVNSVKDAMRNPDYEYADSFKITQCPRSIAPATAYRIRNRWMVAGYHLGEVEIPAATELCAVLRKPTFYRSGEWMTVNIAANHQIPIKVHIL